MSQSDWEASLAKHQQKLKPEVYAKVVQTLDYAMFKTQVDAMEKAFSNKRSTKIILRMDKTFDAIRTFTTVISTMVQSDPGIAALVWGGVLLVLQLSGPFIIILDQFSSMMRQIGDTMPRFQRYLEVFPDADILKEIMRELYDSFVTFLIDAIHWLQGRPWCNVIKSFFRTKIHRRFYKTKADIEWNTTRFEKEIGRATAETTVDIKNALGTPASTVDEPQSTVSLPRNDYFSGRDDLLSKLHDNINANLSRADNRQKSCTIHGIGGSGKTQIALEYTYRYRTGYKHVFWLRAEQPAELATTFASIADRVVLAHGGAVKHTTNEAQKIQAAFDYLSNTADDWLLVFDNVTDYDSMKPYVPCNTHGSIIITTQAADLSTTSAIKVDGFKETDGAALLLKYLRMKPDKRHLANEISNLVGGLPLAIAHIAGFINRSDCTLERMLTLFHERSQSCGIWSSANGTTTLFFERSLETVFDLALGALDDNARVLIECFAFLNPDGIPEDMIFAEHAQKLLSFLCTPQSLRSLSIREQLKGRHLIESIQRSNSSQAKQTSSPNASSSSLTIGSSDTITFFTIHRSLQQSLLYKLDVTPDKRQERFQQAFELLRAVVPRQSPYRAPVNHLWPVYKKYFANVMSLYTCYTNPERPLKPILAFAEMLSDVGNYMWERNLTANAFDILFTAEEICDQVLSPDDPNPIRSGLLAVLASFELNQEPDKRPNLLGHMERVLYLRKRYLETQAPDELTMADGLLLGSAYNNLAWACMTCDDFDRAEVLLEESYRVKLKWGTEETAIFPFAECYKNLAHVRLAKGDSKTALERMEYATRMLIDWRGSQAGATMLFSFIWANMLFCAGDVSGSLTKHLETLKLRKKNLTEEDSYTLDSHHAVGTLYHKLGQLEPAAYHLRLALQRRKTWYLSNTARSLFRLSLVLKDLGENDEAYQCREEAFRIAAPISGDIDFRPTFTEEEFEVAYDLMTPLASGRMFGKMNIGGRKGKSTAI